MNYQALVGKITEYTLLCTSGLSDWLKKKLPGAYGGDWWQKGVVSKLNRHQQETITANNIKTIDGLDLSALLRITDSNWFTLRGRYYLTGSSRETVRKMIGVRNRWAHVSSTTPDMSNVINDLKTIEDFLCFVEINRDAYWEIGQFIDEVRTNKITAKSSAKPIEIAKCENHASIGINSIVRVVSDPKRVGIVTGMDKVGDMIVFNVFVDGTTKEFFEGQVELNVNDSASNLTDISEIQRILTAYQVNKPSSDTLYSLNAARIDFVPYQFRPALKLIKSDSPRLLIADGVGVGKTIEAGLILKEMQARSPLDSVVIICPKPLVVEHKWRDEMKRFDEDFTEVDSNMLKHILEETKRDGELPDKYKRLIIPYSLLTEELVEGKKKKRGRYQIGLNDIEPPPFFDMIIVDEAHSVRNKNTHRYNAVKFFCDNSNIAVFLTATPIQLGDNDLYTLLNLLNPENINSKEAFKAMSEPNCYINEAVRYLRVSGKEKEALEALERAVETDWGRNVISPNPIYRSAIKTLSGEKMSRELRVKMIHDVESLHSFETMINRTRRQDIEDFCVRRPRTLESTFTGRQYELHCALIEFIENVMNTLHPNISLKFLMCTIRRQAASCIFGLAPFINQIVERGLNSLTDDYDIQEEIEDADIEGIDFRSLAENVIKLTENLPPEDNKFDELAKIILERKSLANNKMIIFSTFKHTIKYLNRKIKAIGNIRSDFIYGDVSDDDRRDLRRRFELPQSDPDALDILIFTEIGSEGLDYQFCDTIVNYDLPWNPMRIEQRIGRIDRRGQKSEVAHIYNCITHGTIDEEIHNRCLARIGIFKQSIGDCSEILGSFAKSIKDIILDEKLTEDERSVKMEMLADNEVRRVQEMRRLEDDERQIFGLDISSINDEIEKAENLWLSQNSIERLVSGYLTARVGVDLSRISSDKIKFTAPEKQILCEDYKEIANKYKDVAWQNFLKNNSMACNITYDGEISKNNKEFLITSFHPLVRQAAEYYYTNKPPKDVIEIEISGTDVAPGKYPFRFYSWEYKGGKPRSRLVPVCDNENICDELPVILQTSVSSQATGRYDEGIWNKLGELHLAIWQSERKAYREEMQSLCRFKAESLAKSINALKRSAQKQIDATDNEKVIKMRKGEIERLDKRFAERKRRFEEDASNADILISHLVNGMLIVTEAGKNGY